VCTNAPQISRKIDFRWLVWEAWRLLSHNASPIHSPVRWNRVSDPFSNVLVFPLCFLYRHATETFYSESKLNRAILLCEDEETQGADVWCRSSLGDVCNRSRMQTKATASDIFSARWHGPRLIVLQCLGRGRRHQRFSRRGSASASARPAPVRGGTDLQNIEFPARGWRASWEVGRVATHRAATGVFWPTNR